ncbi:MAG: hypothetical protein M3505_10125, partial [Verrucomicrobiota bacterium]|nr:hypothetical protein [Verrucomicrobiota bacterium]
ARLNKTHHAIADQKETSYLGETPRCHLPCHTIHVAWLVKGSTVAGMLRLKPRGTSLRGC